MKDTTRTFRARYLVTTENTVLSAHDYTLTFTGYGAAIQITLDGQRCSKAIAEAITRLALWLGTWERLSGPELAPAIGKAVAYRLHLQLAGLGYGRGFGVASECLGRTVTSLAALSREDAQEVLSYACGSVGVPTYGLVAA